MEKKIISINSIYRDTITFPNPGKFTVMLDETFKNISSIRLASIELPTLYYTFNNNSNNTFFTIILLIPPPLGSVVTTPTLVTLPITIANGNYGAITLINTINTIFQKINITYGQEFAITSVDLITYTVKIHNILPFTLIFDNNLYLKSLGHRLGFRKDNNSYLYNNQPVDPSLTTSSKTIYSWNAESIVDVTKDAYVYMKLNNYGIIYDNNIKDTLFAKLIMYDQQFIIDTGANFVTKEFVFRQPVNITKLDIELINFDGTTVDTTMLNYSLTLELIQIYDSNKFNDKNFIPH